MPRVARIAPGGVIFHVLNRGNGGIKIFRSHADYAAFLKVMGEVQKDFPTRVLSYCLMPTHWHLILWPAEDGELGHFMQRLTVKHVRRWHENRRTTGYGHLYQGTYKSFPAETDEHLLWLCRYVERNPLRAKLVKRAEEWQWSSLWQRLNPEQDTAQVELSRWPVQMPSNWTELVNAPQTAAEEEAVRESIRRGRPLGDDAWQRRMAARLHLGHTFRPRGRPRKQPSATARAK